MKRLICLGILLLLVACSAPKEVVVKKEVSEEPVVDVVPDFSEIIAKGEAATRSAKQSGGLGTFSYGLTEDNRIVRIEKTGALWEFFYDNGRLVEIKGPESVEFFYEKNKLASIDLGATKLLFVYDHANRLSEIRGGRENLYLEYDSNNYLRGVKRGVAGETSIDYFKDGKIKYLTRGLRTTDVFYDDRGRVRNFDADDAKFIFGYWKDDKVISFTGKTFGGGLTVSYGPDYPPFEALVRSQDDDSRFTAAYTDTLYKVVDDYLYCKYVRRLKELLFEGVSYAFFVNYFGGDMADYIVMQQVCKAYEG